MREGKRLFCVMLVACFAFLIGMSMAQAETFTYVDKMDGKITIPAELSPTGEEVTVEGVEEKTIYIQENEVSEDQYNKYIAAQKAYDDFMNKYSTYDPSVCTDNSHSSDSDHSCTHYDEYQKVAKELEEMYKIVCTDNWVEKSKIEGFLNDTCEEMYKIVVVKVTDKDQKDHYDIQAYTAPVTDESCFPKCAKEGDTYYDDEGKEVTEEEYKEACNPKCRIEKNKYYDDNGNEVTKEEYDEICTPENPTTGNTTPYVIGLGIGAAGIIALYLNKKKKYI